MKWLKNRFNLPQDAVDTHVHVFDPELGPYSAGRAYTPEGAPLRELIAFNQSLSVDSKNSTLVLVQPSPYKDDCSVLMHCLRDMRGLGINAFGIAVLNLNDTTDAELKCLHDLGLRGIRLNFQADDKEVSLARLVAALHQTAERIRHFPGWMIELFIPGWAWDQLHNHISSLPVKIIADHLGEMLGPSKLPPSMQPVPTSQPGFQPLFSLAKQSRVCVKISGLYRMSNDSQSDYRDLQPVIQAFAQDIPNDIIWGSDWPHTGDGHERIGRSLDVREPFRIVDDHAVLRNLHAWMGDGVYRKMLVENPRRLYLSEVNISKPNI